MHWDVCTETLRRGARRALLVIAQAVHGVGPLDSLRYERSVQTALLATRCCAPGRYYDEGSTLRVWLEVFNLPIHSAIGSGEFTILKSDVDPEFAHLS